MIDDHIIIGNSSNITPRTCRDRHTNRSTFFELSAPDQAPPPHLARIIAKSGGIYQKTTKTAKIFKNAGNCCFLMTPSPSSRRMKSPVQALRPFTNQGLRLRREKLERIVKPTLICSGVNYRIAAKTYDIAWQPFPFLSNWLRNAQ
ncbi:hypothetical protein [Marinobacterium aestuariivivens]|uniref:PLD phosphodiesterase domain-containing protein n=1 Tax=Marinobacterium aestuariivivens TaxID=1698799 RepID=A0ABW1ZZC3_9GAMM